VKAKKLASNFGINCESVKMRYSESQFLALQPRIRVLQIRYFVGALVAPEAMEGAASDGSAQLETYKACRHSIIEG